MSLLVPIDDVSQHIIGFPEVAAVTFTAVGGLIVPRQPHNAIGWLFIAIGVSSGLGVVGAAVPGQQVLSWIAAWSPGLAYGLLPPALLLFPDGRLPMRAWRPVMGFAVLSAGFLSVESALSAWARPRLFSTDVTVVLDRAGLLGIVVSMVAAAAALFVRLRRASGDVRQQVKWLGVGMALVPIGIALQLLSVPGAWILAATTVPTSAAVAMLRFKLYDVDLFLNRSLVYATLTALSIGLYVGAVEFVGTIFPGAESWRRVVATGLIAVAFGPLRVRIQRIVNHLLYGDRDDPYAVVSRLGRSLEQAGDPAAVLARVVETVADALQLPYAAVAAVGGAAPGRMLASHGRHIGTSVPFDMTYQGDVVGRLLVDPRSPRQPFTGPERLLLEDLARQAGLAVHAVGLTADLRRSRERLVRSREEERRRLRRDLHDGLGPTLAGMTMQVGAARALLRPDPVRAEIAFRELELQLQECIKEIRHLVDGLHPSVLDRLGLLGAIKHQVSTLAGTRGGTEITLDVHDVGELPAAVEVAAYRIVNEAITNSVRHAAARHCRITLTLGSGLSIDVTDDGAGIPADYRPGVGLSSMRERAEELGGTFDARRQAGGGTRIRAELPLDLSLVRTAPNP